MHDTAYGLENQGKLGKSKEKKRQSLDNEISFLGSRNSIKPATSSPQSSDFEMDSAIRTLTWCWPEAIRFAAIGALEASGIEGRKRD